MTHRIRKQVMDLRISSRLDAFKTQHLAGHYYYRCMLPALEKIFDSLSDAEEVVCIDKLELDLGVITPAALQSGQLEQGLMSELHKQIEAAWKQQGEKTNIRRSGHKENISRQWLYYLQHGCLNWNAGGFDNNAYQAILEIFATNYTLMHELRNLMRNNRHAVVRMVREHPEPFLVSLVEILTSAAQNELPEYVGDFVRLFSRAAKTNITKLTVINNRYNVWQQLLQFVAANDTRVDTRTLIQQWLIALTDKKWLPPDLPTPPKHSRIYPVWQRLNITKSPNNRPAVTKQPESKENVETKTDNNADELHPVSKDGIYVSHAGLVLLHPFLSTFFNRLELVAGNRFRNKAALSKAVHMLHYLATGELYGKEYQLVVPKQLCGMPLQQALHTHTPIEKEDREEADGLLSAAIEKWEKLKNVSVAALRESFLQRPGKLYTKNDSIYLQVENGPLDVLLDYLPWNLGIIKLPWMKEILRVEWR